MSTSALSVAFKAAEECIDVILKCVCVVLCVLIRVIPVVSPRPLEGILPIS